MKKCSEKKGFTLAELLIVVAIIGVLVAISIPIFTNNLRKARLATNQANARAALASITTTVMEDGVLSKDGHGYVQYDSSTGTSKALDTSSGSIKVRVAYDADISSWDYKKRGYEQLGDTVFDEWTAVYEYNELVEMCSIQYGKH